MGAQELIGKMALSEFEKCIKENRLKKESVDGRLIEKEFASALHDLKSAKRSLEERDFHWSVSQSYYACFHAAKALVLRRGYREKGHYCLAVAVDELCPEIPSSLKGLLLSLRRMRESADYTLEEISKEDAMQALGEASEFLEVAGKTLGKKA